eukprot:8810732-Pyramimonas_sp.AAC.1
MSRDRRGVRRFRALRFSRGLLQGARGGGPAPAATHGVAVAGAADAHSESPRASTAAALFGPAKG